MYDKRKLSITLGYLMSEQMGKLFNIEAPYYQDFVPLMAPRQTFFPSKKPIEISVRSF
jgi:hypothetical protein